MLKTLLLLSSLTLSSFTYSATTGQVITALEINNMGLHIGDIKTSVLDQAQFQTIHGSCWVLMDGRNISGKDLAVLTGRSTVPDARGTFLRGKDNGVGRNVDGDTALGTYQVDTIQNITGDIYSADVGVTRSTDVANGAFYKYGSGTTYLRGYQGGAGGQGLGFDASRSARTSLETRPKNITVNYFIKIHKTCN